MKVALIYLHIAGKPEFRAHSERFMESYVKFPSGTEHDLHVVNCNGLLTRETVSLFHPHAVAYHQYDGGGFDIGAHHSAGKMIEADFLVCTSSQTYFKKEGWLKRFVEAREAHGDGLYGAMSNNDYIAPHAHIRTCFYGLDPVFFKSCQYPLNSKEDSFQFEHGEDCISKQFADAGKPVLMVTWDGCYEKRDWRTPPNIFRSGDQSNLIAFDRHSEHFEIVSPEIQALLTRYSNGWSDATQTYRALS